MCFLLWLFSLFIYLFSSSMLGCDGSSGRRFLLPGMPVITTQSAISDNWNASLIRASGSLFGHVMPGRTRLVLKRLNLPFESNLRGEALTTAWLLAYLHFVDKIVKRLLPADAASQTHRAAVHEAVEGRIGSHARPQKHALERYCSLLGEQISGPFSRGTLGSIFGMA